MCINNTFQYNTAENNWRASSLGFFGGQQNKALNCVIIDPMEAGLRATCDFSGTGFGTTGTNLFHNISVYKGGVASGAMGVTGDFWGNQQGAIHLSSSPYYNLTNITLDSIDLIGSKNNAVYLGSGSFRIVSLIMNNIHIDGTGQYGVYYNSASGNGSFCNISYANVGAGINTNGIPAAFTFVENCTNTAITDVNANELKVISTNDTLTVIGFTDSSISVYDMHGNLCCRTLVTSNEAMIPNLKSGIYLVRLDSSNTAIKALVR